MINRFNKVRVENNKFKKQNITKSYLLYTNLYRELQMLLVRVTDKNKGTASHDLQINMLYIGYSLT